MLQALSKEIIFRIWNLKMTLNKNDYSDSRSWKQIFLNKFLKHNFFFKYKPIPI